MEVFQTIDALQSHLKHKRDSEFRIGLVPTMGALHEGHLSLMRQCLSENDLLVVSIFVNPTQFDRAEDLKNYPRTLERDLNLLQTLKGELCVFAPEAAEIYGTIMKAEPFSFDGLEHQMEGKFRKGHFDGVGTIVRKLLEIVAPHRAYFGEKDFQQLQIIKKLVDKLQLPVEIVGCPISREPNGLARSSRNERLSSAQQEESTFIYRTLTAAKEQFGTKSADDLRLWVEQAFAQQEALELEYVEIADEQTLVPVTEFRDGLKYRMFVAAFIDGVRLIDNIALN